VEQLLAANVAILSPLERHTPPEENKQQCRWQRVTDQHSCGGSGSQRLRLRPLVDKQYRGHNARNDNHQRTGDFQKFDRLAVAQKNGKPFKKTTEGGR
jgi:hypothetical protein